MGAQGKTPKGKHTKKKVTGRKRPEDRYNLKTNANSIDGTLSNAPGNKTTRGKRDENELSKKEEDSLPLLILAKARCEGCGTIGRLVLIIDFQGPRRFCAGCRRNIGKKEGERIKRGTQASYCGTENGKR